MKIGQLVKQNISLIIEYCNKVDTNELNNLLDDHYSHITLGLNFPFFIELKNINNGDPKSEKIRYYKDVFNVCNKHVKLTSQWFEYHTEKFTNYIQKIKNGLDKNKIIPDTEKSIIFSGEIEYEDESIETTNFTYERDLQNSLISQTENLFPGYKIYRKNEGIEYPVEGRRIDLLLENKETNTLLAIELKAGVADFKVFGQISMYLGLLSKEFPDKNIIGCIIAGEIDNSLKHAASTNNNITLFEYQMKISIDEVTL